MPHHPCFSLIIYYRTHSWSKPTYTGYCPLSPKYDTPLEAPLPWLQHLPSQLLIPSYSVLTELASFLLCSSTWMFPDRCPAWPALPEAHRFPIASWEMPKALHPTESYRVTAEGLQRMPASFQSLILTCLSAIAATAKQKLFLLGQCYISPYPTEICDQAVFYCQLCPRVRFDSQV